MYKFECYSVVIKSLKAKLDRNPSEPLRISNVSSWRIA